VNRLTKGSTSSEAPTSPSLTGDSRLRTPESVAAIILAAGRSTRMGSFKPLLPFGASTVIETCIENLRDGGVETIVVVVGHRAEDIKERLKSCGVIFAVNPDSGSEMTASIACAVPQLPVETKAVLITPADHPAVPAEVITTLINEWNRGAVLVVPTWNDRGGHPVLIDLGFRDELLRLDPNLGLRRLFDAHQDQVRRVAVNSNSIARDMDTWDDYRALHEDVFGVPPPELPIREPA
jgi:molybdenum cofactor cytidylyltransferase